MEVTIYPDEIWFQVFKNMMMRFETPQSKEMMLDLMSSEGFFDIPSKADLDSVVNNCINPYILFPLSFVCKHLRQMVTMFTAREFSKNESKFNLKGLGFVSALLGSKELLKWSQTFCDGLLPECSAAIMSGNIDLLEFIFPPDNFTNTFCSDAAIFGKLEVLIWLRTKHNCEWNNWTTRYAAKYGHLDILKYALDNHCPFEKSMICFNAAQHGHLEILKWAKDNSYYSVDEKVFYVAAAYGSLEMLKWLRENACPWNESVCYVAARHGNLEILKWLRENACPWDEKVCYAAAKGGNLKLLKWLRENDCPWDEKVCCAAASGGNLEILKWLRENACPWNDIYCYAAAAYGGQLEILMWLKENSFTWDEAIYECAALKGHKKIFQWAYENGLPFTYETYKKIDDNFLAPTCINSWLKDYGLEFNH